MNFSEKLRALRKQFAFSQEQLAEKIGVSRQAITKWETDGGLPDVENLIAIAALFSVSIDDLLSEEKLVRAASDYAYESLTEYDISGPTHFDIKVPGALEVNLTVADDEKLRVRLASNVLQSLAQDYKVQLDEHRSRLDVDIRRVGPGSEAEGKEALFAFISLPAKYCNDAELSAACGVFRLNGTSCPVEFGGKTRGVYLENVEGTVALNCSTDMEIHANGLPAVLEINQINATSVLRVPAGVQYFTKIKGKSNQIRFAMGGKPASDPSETDAEHCIELTGMNAELLIDRGAVR